PLEARLKHLHARGGFVGSDGDRPEQVAGASRLFGGQLALPDGGRWELQPRDAIGRRVAVSDVAPSAEGLELDRRADRSCELGEQVRIVSRPGSSARVEDTKAADGVAPAPEDGRRDEGA